MASSIRPITHRQMRTVEFWIQSGFRSKAKALKAAGYGSSVISHPNRVFNSPTVLDELARRGYDKYGLRREVEVRVYDEPVAPIAPEIDFSQIKKEDLQWLKEKLATTPDIPMQYVSSSYSA